MMHNAVERRELRHAGPVAAAIDFGFVREEVTHCYGKNGDGSVIAAMSGDVGCSESAEKISPNIRTSLPMRGTVVNVV